MPEHQRPLNWSGAVVASQGVLGELMATVNGKPVHRNTVRRALKVLESERWIEVIELGGKGGALAYVVNSRVAWADRRDKLPMARFSAQVLASAAEQRQPLENRAPLRKIPTLMRGDQQLPDGPGENPPSQQALDGLSPDLPAIVTDEDGCQWEVDRETGELQRLITND